MKQHYLKKNYTLLIIGSLFFLCCAPPSNEFENQPVAGTSIKSNQPTAPTNDPNVPKITKVSAPAIAALQCNSTFNIAVDYLDPDSTLLHIKYTMSYGSHEVMGEKDNNAIEANVSGTINVPLFVDCNTLDAGAQQDVRIQFAAIDSSNKSSASAETTVRVQK